MPTKRPVPACRLHQARLRAGLSQEQLGILAGLDPAVSSARMSRYEAGVHEPPFAFVEVLAGILRVPPAYFYCADDDLADVIVAYGVASPRQRAQIRRLAQPAPSA